MTSASAPLNPLIVSPGELFGGVERQVLDLCGELARRGEQPVPVVFHDAELAAQARAAGLAPVVVSGARDLTRLGRERGSRVWHLHGYRATVVAALARRTVGVGLVKTVHGLPEAAAGHRFVNLKSRLYHRLENLAERRLRARICYVTADIRSRHDAVHAGLSRRVVHNGLDDLPDVPRPRPAVLAREGFHVGLVGRVSDVKGIHFALRALTAADVPAALRLHVIGTGPLAGPLADEARALGVAERVEFHGFRRDVLDFIANLDALLMPSLHEGLPYTLLEAMALGVPVAASRVGGLAEVLRHDETGLLFEVGDVAGIAAVLSRLIHEPGLRDRLGEAGRREQRERYTLARMTDDYLQEYAAARG